MTASPELVNAAVDELEAALRGARVELPPSARYAELALETGLRARGSTWDCSGAPELLRTDEGVVAFARYRVVTGADHDANQELPHPTLIELGITADVRDALLLPQSRTGTLQPFVLREALFLGLQSLEGEPDLSQPLGSAFLAAALKLRPMNAGLVGAIHRVPRLGRLVMGRLRAHLFSLDGSPDLDEDFLRVVAAWLARYPPEGRTHLIPDLTPGDLDSFEAAKRVSKRHSGPPRLSLPQARVWYEVARPVGPFLWTLVATRDARAAWSLARSSHETTGMVPLLVPLEVLPMALGIGNYEFAAGAGDAIAAVSRGASDCQAGARGEPPVPGQPVAWPSLEERFDSHRVLALVLVNATEGWRAVAALRDPQAWPGVAMLSRLRILEQRYGVVPLVLDPYQLAGLVRPRSLTRGEAWDAMQGLNFAHSPSAGSWFDEKSGGVESLMHHDVWWLDLND